METINGNATAVQTETAPKIRPRLTKGQIASAVLKLNRITKPDAAHNLLREFLEHPEDEGLLSLAVQFYADLK